MVGFMLHRAGHRDLARAHDLLDAERAHQRDKRLDFVVVAGDLDGHRARPDIDHMGAKGGDDRIEFGARALIHRDFHHHHFAIDGARRP